MCLKTIISKHIQPNGQVAVEYLGHKSEREFLEYIKVGKEESAQNLSKHPYFMGKMKITK